MDVTAAKTVHAAIPRGAMTPSPHFLGQARAGLDLHHFRFDRTGRAPGTCIGDRAFAVREPAAALARSYAGVHGAAVRTAFPGIAEAACGTLFLVEGRHGILDLFTGARTVSDPSVAHFHDNARSRKAFCAGRGIAFTTWIFPDKLYALRDRLPAGPAIRSVYLSRYRDAGPPDPSAHYPVDAVAAEGSYYRTDTHYAPEGVASLACAVFAATLGESAAESCRAAIARDMTRDHVYAGDMGRKFMPPRTERVRLLDPAIPVVKAENGFANGNDGILVLIESQAALSSQTLLIFGDSFFRQMLPCLAYGFRRIVFCRTRYLHREMVAAIRPDQVFAGLAEKYLSDVAPDSEAPPFLAYPLIFGKPARPEAGFADLWNAFADMKAMNGAF